MGVVQVGEEEGGGGSGGVTAGFNYLPPLTPLPHCVNPCKQHARVIFLGWSVLYGLPPYL